MSAPAKGGVASPAAKPVSQLKTVGDLTSKFDMLKRGRMHYENQWKLNVAFYKGRQYSYYNKFTGTIQTLATEDHEKPKYRVRLVSNQIISGAHSLLAKYTKTKPIITATPSTGDPSAAKAAQMAERLLEYWWDDFQLDDKLAEAILWAIVTGQGYWKITWDPHANKQMTFTLDPRGNPITDDTIKDAFKQQLEAQGIKPQEKVVYLGDIRVEAMSPFNVYLDPTARTFDDCKFVICVHNLDPDEIKARWGVDIVPDSSSTEPDVALPFANAEDASVKTVKKVYIGYFLPSPTLPKGRYVVWTDGPDKNILEDTPWPYPDNILPIVKFPGLRTPGAIYDSSHVEQAIPVQKELNRTLSQIVEYKNLTIKPRIFAPTGSLRMRMTSEPGQIVEYNPVGNFKPELETVPAMPPYVFELLNDVSSRLKDIFGLTEISEGTVPPNVEAGIAIDLLQELGSDRLVPTIRLIEKAMARAGQIMLGLAQKYYIEPRMFLIKGTGGSVSVKKFMGADINGVTVHTETGSAAPRTRAGRQAQIERWVDMRIIPPDRAWKYLDIADLKGLAAQYAADEDQAQREIEKMLEGVPINPEAAQQAMQLANSPNPVNPETGQPFQSPQELQQYIQNAAVQPLIGENYDVHLDVVGNFMKSVEFETLDTEVRQRFITHWTLTLQAKMALPVLPDPQAVKTTLQLKGTVGPTVASEILNRGGVLKATPEQMAEPPLETWVSDSVDDPDTDAAGPGQEANNLSQAAATVLESNQKIAQAQQDGAHKNLQQEEAHGQKLDHNQTLHETQTAKNLQEMSQRDQLHQVKMAQEHAKLALAEKKAKESSFKPKPAAKKPSK